MSEMARGFRSASGVYQDRQERFLGTPKRKPGGVGPGGLALQVGEEDPPTKNLTKKKPHILRPVLDAAEMILQFFLGLLACIFR